MQDAVAEHLCPPLTDDDTASLYRLVPIHLNAKPLGVGVTPVLGRASPLLVRALHLQVGGAALAKTTVWALFYTN